MSSSIVWLGALAPLRCTRRANWPSSHRSRSRPLIRQRTDRAVIDPVRQKAPAIIRHPSDPPGDQRATSVLLDGTMCARNLVRRCDQMLSGGCIRYQLWRALRLSSLLMGRRPRHKVAAVACYATEIARIRRWTHGLVRGRAVSNAARSYRRVSSACTVVSNHNCTSLEPIQEDRIHAEWFGRVKRRNMMRIMARRREGGDGFWRSARSRGPGGGCG